MNYRVHYTKRGYVFKTLKEASAFAEMIRKETRIILAITETRAKVTHTFEI